MMRRIVAVAALVLAGGCSPSTPARAPDGGAPDGGGAATVATDPVLARVAGAVGRGGAAAYLTRVRDDDPDWQHVLARLSAGDGGAIALARRLRPAADAGTAESLDTAAARGLVAAPVAVLGLTQAGAGIEALCTSPFIEPEAGVERRYNRAALEALDRVPVAARPQPAFDGCHRALERIGATLPG